jgi:hypothetical protein
LLDKNRKIFIIRLSKKRMKVDIREEAFGKLRGLLASNERPALSSVEISSILDTMSQEEIQRMMSSMGLRARELQGRYNYLWGVYSNFGARLTGVFIMLSKPREDYNSWGAIKRKIREAREYAAQPALEADALRGRHCNSD